MASDHRYTNTDQARLTCAVTCTVSSQISAIMYDNCTCVLGLPNALGGYDETPEIMAGHLKVHACMQYHCLSFSGIMSYAYGSKEKVLQYQDTGDPFLTVC